MNRKYLIESAKKLNAPSQESVNEYAAKMDILVASLNSKMLNRTDLNELIGVDNLEMMKDNHANHARFMHSIFQTPNAEVFVDTILWVFRAYRSHGFSSNYWAAQLNAWMELLKKELTEKSFTEIIPFYKWMQINIPVFVKVSDEKLEQKNSLH